MDALVLSGGSIKGSWQAGAIAEVLAAGITPEIVTGISVGAINAAALAAWQPQADSDYGWLEVGTNLASFWEDNITSPKQIAHKRRWYELGWRFLTKTWAGFVDMTPVETLLRETLGEIPTGPLQAQVGCVNLRTGRLEYHPAHDLDAVMASAMEPVGMPTHTLDGDPYVDGGVREIAPLAQAIHLGATRIVAIVCQPEGASGWSGNPGDLMKLVGRLLGVVTNEIVTNDLRTCRAINARVLAGTSDKRYIELIVIRPLKGLEIDIMDFDGEDIRRMVQQGRADARRVLGSGLAKAA